MTYSTDNRTDPRPEVRTGPTYVNKVRSNTAGWLIAGIVIVAAIIAMLMLAPFNRTVTTTDGTTTPKVENNVNVQPPATTAPSTTNVETQPAPQTTAPATPTAPAAVPPAATAQPAAPATTP